MIDIKDPCRSFTWRNNQECPIMTTLDRILALVDWSVKHLLAKVTILPKGVSDHNPLVIMFGEKLQIKDPIFRFEKWWLEVEGFSELVKKIWDIECPVDDTLEVWQFKRRLLRKKIKGWSRNIEVELKKTKNSLLVGIDDLDRLAKN
jgi:hypothetical protein